MTNATNDNGDFSNLINIKPNTESCSIVNSKKTSTTAGITVNCHYGKHDLEQILTDLIYIKDMQ